MTYTVYVQCIYLPPPVMFYCRYLSLTVMSIRVWVICVSTVHCFSSVCVREREKKKRE